MATGLAGVLVLGSTGCEQLPGSPGTQGAAIGGVGGAITGAAGASHERLWGALIGGALGAGGGYLIGANKDRILGKDRDAAQQAMQRAQTTPATPQQALAAPTADINGDGFVTMDEVVAMKRAGLSDDQMLAKLRATGQVFELTPEQQNYLRNNGVDDYVINEMPTLNREIRNQITAPTGTPPSVISQPNPPYPNAPTTPAPGY